MAAPMSRVFRRLPCLPVVVILGATGTGKSKLAIQIGARFGGEIISADSMQVYKGLDIITNKVTADEQRACSHHLIDFLNPLSRYTVVDFRNKALPIIEGLLKEKKLPVIVGGTNYYIEALLWKVLLDAEGSETDDLLLKVRGDPVSLRIRRKRKCPEPPAAIAMEEGLRKKPDTSLDSSETGGVPCSAIAGKAFRTCDSEAEGDSSAHGLSECISKSDVQSSVPGGATNSGCSMDVPVPRGPDLNAVLESDEGKVQRLTNAEDGRDIKPELGGTLAVTVGQGQLQTTEPVSSDESSTQAQADISTRNAKPDTSLSEMDSGEFMKDFSRHEADDPRKEEDMMTVDVEGTSTEDLYQILAEVDPCRANSLHPNNRRKIIRSLQVYEQHGRTHSEVLSGQQGEEGGGPLGGPLRFKDVCILWLQCDQEVLDKRLDARVDDMLSRGLLKELADFHQGYNKQRLQSQANSETLYTQGIFQSIGFKEFHPYLILPEGERDSDEAKCLLKEGIEKLKLATRQYARRQIRWVKNRFVRRPGTNVPPVFAVDSTDPALWDERVLKPALAVLDAMLEGDEPSIAPLEHEGGRSSSEDASARHVCDICGGRVFVGEQQWLGHLKSKRHYKKARKLKLASLMLSDKAETASEKP